MRRNIFELERRGIQQKAGEIIRFYSRTSFPDYDYVKRNSLQGERNSSKLGVFGGAGGRKASRIKEILFNEDGEVIREERYALSESTGQAKKNAANVTKERFYSKADAAFLAGKNYVRTANENSEKMKKVRAAKEARNTTDNKSEKFEKARINFDIISLIVKKGYKKGDAQLINAKSPDVTVKTGSVATPINSIPDSGEKINTTGEKSFDSYVSNYETSQRRKNALWRAQLKRQGK